MKIDLGYSLMSLMTFDVYMDNLCSRFRCYQDVPDVPVVINLFAEIP